MLLFPSNSDHMLSDGRLNPTELLQVLFRCLNKPGREATMGKHLPFKFKGFRQN